MDTGQHILVLSIDGEGVVDLSVAALLVLEEKRRVVECGELDEAKVMVFVNAPVWCQHAVFRQAASPAPNHDVVCPIHYAREARFFVVDTLILQ